MKYLRGSFNCFLLGIGLFYVLLVLCATRKAFRSKFVVPGENDTVPIMKIWPYILQYQRTPDHNIQTKRLE